MVLIRNILSEAMAHDLLAVKSREGVGIKSDVIAGTGE